MKLRLKLSKLVLPVFLMLCTGVSTAFAFEGEITATLTRGGQTQSLLYTVGTNQLRIECGENDRPYAKDIVDLTTADVTLLFPNNRSFVRLNPGTENQSAAPAGFPGMPNPQGMPGMAMPAGVGPQTATPGPAPGNIGPTNLPGMPGMPQMPQRQQIPQMPQMPPGVGPQGGPSTPNMSGMPMMMPMMPMEQIDVKATGDTTNLLGYTCTRYVLKQRGEVMEIWATDKLLPFQPYLENQPHRFGPHRIEEQWGGVLKAKRLFPVLAVLRFDRPPTPGSNEQSAPGPERLRFEVTAVTPEKITDATLFQPPPDYQEIQPLPF